MTKSLAVRFRLSAHLGYLFSQLPLIERFAAAARAGFHAIEIPYPYELSAIEFRSACERNELDVAQIALRNGNSAAASKGLAALPGREAEFDEALMLSVTYAKAVNCQLIHPMAGLSVASEPLPEWEVYLSNLSKCCSVAANEGLCVIIEAISRHAVRDYFLNSLELARTAIELVNAPNLRLSLDTYHAAAMGIDLPTFIALNGAKIGHVQIADHPGRGEPGSGKINFNSFFASLHDSSYKGYVGLEYVCRDKATINFDWIRGFDQYLEPLGTSCAGAIG